MRILPSLYFKKKYRKFIKRHSDLSDTIDKQLKLLAENRSHPSLKLHKLTGQKSENWSISVTKSIRLIIQFVPENIILIDIGSHEEVY